MFADEVYQENIYETGKRFISFNEVREKLGEPYSKLELCSFHSISKGIIGECGLRGGYAHCVNLDEAIMEQIVKLRSINLCSNTVGQIMVDLMCNPPNSSNSSASTVELFERERSDLFLSLKKRAEVITQKLNQIKNIKCNTVQGAMYAFPRVFLGKSIIEEAKKQAVEPDLYYCMKALEETGIALVPGSGFR